MPQQKGIITARDIKRLLHKIIALETGLKTQLIKEVQQRQIKLL